jgi:S-adenosylmethionine/arginine decarboxylase-like enzyme
MTVAIWGWQADVNLAGCDPEWVTKPNGVHTWVRDLVKTIAMTPHGEPDIERFGVGPLNGISVYQKIETSHIHCHFNDAGTTGFLTVFSCQPFALHTVIEQLRRVLRPASIHAVLSERAAGKLPKAIDAAVDVSEPVTA